MPCAVGVTRLPDAVGAALATAGAAVLVGVTVDVLATVLDVSHGAGPFTGPTGRRIWLRLVDLRHSGMPAGVLRVGGILLTAMVIVAWLLALVAGWTLIYLADESALRIATTGEPAGGIDRIYFATSSLFTLSLGDVVPGASGWRLVAAANAGSGLLLLTLSITYAVPVIEAVTRRRIFAGTVATLGGDAAEIVANHDRAQGEGALMDELPTLRRSIIEMAHLHLAYPVLHYFHSSDRRDAFGPNLAALYDALVTLERSWGEGPGGERAALVRTRATIEASLDPLLLDHDTGRVPPSLPGCHHAAGDPCRLESDLAQHRGKLAALVYEEGWSWEDPTGRDITDDLTLA